VNAVTLVSPPDAPWFRSVISFTRAMYLHWPQQTSKQDHNLAVKSNFKSIRRLKWILTYSLKGRQCIVKNSSLFPDGIRAALCSHRDIWQLRCGVDIAAGPGRWPSFTWLCSFLPPSCPSKSKEKYRAVSHLG